MGSFHYTLTRTRRDRIGHTLMEVLISAFIFSLALFAAYGGWASIKNHYYQQSAFLEIRQSSRSAFNHLSRELRQASYVYLNYNGYLDGHYYNVPNFDDSGDNIIFAIPENQPTDPDIYYTVVGLYLRDRQPADPSNPDARQLVMYEKRNILPPLAEKPGSIDLSSLSGGYHRVIADYVAPNGFSFDISNPAKNINFRLEFIKKSLSSTKEESDIFYNNVTIRNI